ncbi:MAG: hypothetical protein WC846_04580 [Candidatus Gracilibacteria bacterium]|jgi:hypothetical protein
MTPITKTCAASGKPFVITDEDQAFYAKIGVPMPTLCPEERMRRRLAFRNERNLYHRKCDLCKKEVISMYDTDSPYIVYCQNCFWGDNWDPTAFAQEVDFSRPFFDQFAELMEKVPRISLMNKDHENAEYGNFTLRNKNSYLLTTSAECEDAFYSKRCWNCRSIAECSNCSNCELCYETLDSRNCYNSKWLQNSAECTDCTLGYNLRGCKNCFGCFNLINKSYCIHNQQFTREEYEKKLLELHKNLPAEIENFSTLSIPRKYMDAIQTENCSGDAVYRSRNAQYCFDSVELEDCEFVCDATHLKDARDVNNDDHSELVYEIIGGESSYMNRFNDICWFDKYITYCSLCFNSENLFGCVGMKRRKFCILNKQYSQEEYETLAARLIEYMRATGEWGEFFPMTLSPFAYNETVAEEHFPLTKDEVMQKGLKWKNESENTSYLGPKLSPPLNVSEAGPEVTKNIFTCRTSGKLYKITPQELALYKKMDLPLPQKTPDQRFKEHMSRKNPRSLWMRPCSLCGKQLQTVYGPNRSEAVYCEECYLKTVY